MKSLKVARLLYIFILILAAASVATAAVAVPAPLTPAAGASLTAPLTISWSAVTDPSGILGYNWQASASSTFSTIAAQNSTNVGITQDTVSGLANGTYFWRVQAVNGAFVQGAWSAASSFTITGAGAGALAPPTMGPTKGYSTFHPLEVITFNWTPVPGAASYLLQAATDPSFPVITRIQFDNIPNPTFSFASGNEGNYSARVFAVDANGVASAPSNIITYSVSYNNPLPAPPSLIAPNGSSTLTLPITFTWTDVPNPQPSGYELQIAKDSGFSNIEIDSPQLNNASRTEISLTPGAKFWRVRSAQGDASPTTAAVTKWSASGTFSVSSAPAPVSLAFTSNPLYSGNFTWVQVQLTSAAPAGGATISLTSSNPAAAPVPATVMMPGNTAWMQFQMQAGQVVSSTPVTLTATLNGASASAQINVLPPSLKSLIISPNSINGGAQAGAIAMLNGQAPAGGAAISFSSSSSAVLAPAVATIAAGDASVSFGLPTTSVTANTTATVTASWNGTSVQAPLTVTPQGQPASIALSPTSVTGTTGSFATVRIAAAAAVDQIFQVSSNNPAVSVPGSVLIPAGTTAGGFNVITQLVTAQTLVTISVSGGGVTQSAVLTLNPAAAPAATATLTVTASGRSGEFVTSSPAGINVAVGSSASASLTTGNAVKLTVSNGRSAIWSGACSSGGNKTNSCTFTLTGNASVSANVQ